MIVFSLAIAHTPWVPARVASMARLQAEVEASDPVSVYMPAGHYHVEDERAPNHVWSEHMWKWAAATTADWCVFLNDDACLAPGFFERLEDIIQTSGKSQTVIGLQVAHPIAVPLAAEGISGFTTSDGMIGVGYAIERRALMGFLEWRAHALKSGAVEFLPEDTLIGLWCAVGNRKVFHPIPTIVDHDTSIESTYGNDSHANRRSLVRWDTELPAGVASPRIPHVGRYYESTPHRAQEWVTTFGPKQFQAILADTGHRELKRLNYARKARGVESTARVFIATPVRGGVSPHYAASIWRLLADEEIDFEGGLEIADVQQWSADVVRVRSRYVSHFLNQTECTHLLFLDADIEVSPKVIRGMLAAGKDFVGAPYPRREGVDWKRVRDVQDMPAEAVAYRYPVRLLDDKLEVFPNGCGEVEALPLGCALLTRKGLQDMSDAHPALAFDDGLFGPSVALFQLILAGRALMSEDFSFCHRWRARGGAVWMYLGDGSPVNHHGEHVYRGDVGAFGLRRGS